MKHISRHTGRGSYNLFANHSHCLPGIKGMLLLFALLLLGSLLGELVVMAIGLFSQDLALNYSTVISYPLMFIPAWLYVSGSSRRNEFFDTGYALDSNNFGTKGGFWMAVIVSVSTVAASFVTDPISLIMPEEPEWFSKAMEMIMDMPVWLTLISVSVFAPFFEEWLCRGLVLRGLLQKMSPAAAISVSALFFALIHLNPWQAVPAFILGLLFGYVYYRTGSLKLTMLMHCVNNTMAVIFSRIPALKEADTFIQVMEPWAYVCYFIASLAFLWGAIVTIRTSTSFKDENARCNCDTVEPLSID